MEITGYKVKHTDLNSTGLEVVFDVKYGDNSVAHNISHDKVMTKENGAQALFVYTKELLRGDEQLSEVIQKKLRDKSLSRISLNGPYMKFVLDYLITKSDTKKGTEDVYGQEDKAFRKKKK